MNKHIYVVHYDTGFYKYTCVAQVAVSDRKTELEEARAAVARSAHDLRRITSVCGPVSVYE